MISLTGSSKARRRRKKMLTYLSLHTSLVYLILIMCIAQQADASSVRSSSACPNKSWTHLGKKCYRIYHSPRSSVVASSRCVELNAQLAIIEDDSLKERESSSKDPTNIFKYLEITEAAKNESRGKQFYVSLSQELRNQYVEKQQNGYNRKESRGEPYEHSDSEIILSDLWLPREDSSLMNIADNSSISKEETAFVFTYSKQYMRWGIVPMPASRKVPFICEKPANDKATQSRSVFPNEQQSASSSPSGLSTSFNSDSSANGDGESQSASDLNEQNSPRPSPTSPSDNRKPNSESPTYNIDTARPSTTPLPEISSMLFRESPQDQLVVVGSTAEMRCIPLKANSSQLVWTLNGKNLPSLNRIKQLNGTLRIDQVRNSDIGNYTCTITSAGLSESKSARLELVDKPYPPEYVFAELLDKSSTSVRVKWNPGFNGFSPIIKYLVEMRTVNVDFITDNDLNSLSSQNQWELAKANISADQTSVIIQDLRPAKKYIFRIKATNKIGTSDPSLPSRNSIEVPVQPPSSPPENLSGAPKNSTSILLQWSPPPPDAQNGLLKGYVIRHKLEGYTSDSDWYINQVPDAIHTSFMIEDLIVFKNYEIQIAAENDRGVGPFSTSIFVKTKEGKPDMGPRSVSASSLSAKEIRVTWLPPPPPNINGVNLGYRLQIWYDSALTHLAKELTVPHNTISPNHAANVDGLLPYTEYHVTVKCFTGAGDGPPNEDNVVVRTNQALPESVQSIEFSEILDKSLKVSWKPPKRLNGELTHYTMEYSESQFPDRKAIKKFQPSIVESRVYDLTPQTSYTFKIYPHTIVGPGPEKIGEIKTSVPPVLPEPPINLVVSNIGPESVDIQFSPGFSGNANIDKWIAEALIPSRDAPRWQTIYESTNHSQESNSVTVRKLRPFTRYRIRLTPVNIVGSSLKPSEPTAEFSTSQIEPEQPPRDLLVNEVKTNSAKVHWLPLPSTMWMGNPRGYNLTWIEINNSSIQFHLIEDIRVNSFTVKDLEEFTDYAFRIYAVNEAGSSPPSEEVFITTLEDVPSSGPTNLTAHATSSHAISVDWNTIPKRHRNGIIRGYKIQYLALYPEAHIQHKTIEDNTTRHVSLNQLKPYTTYQLAVAAFTSAGDGVFSPILTAQTFEDTPGPIQNLSNPTVSQSDVRILWDPPENPNGEILGYKVSYQSVSKDEGPKEVSTQELHPNEHTFKATNLKPDTHYFFTVTAKTKEGWGQQASILLHTHDSELRSHLPFFKEPWFVIMCASLSFVVTVIVTACLFIQTKSYKYKQEAIKSTSQDHLGDTGFSIADDEGAQQNNGFGLLSQGTSGYGRTNGTGSQSTANFTLPKTPPRPHPGSVAYSDDDEDDDVFEDIVDKAAIKSTGTSHYDSSGDSIIEKPSEMSSSTAPESESADEEYVNMANRQFVNHYANVNGTIRGQKGWKKNTKHYSSHKSKPKLPQRPAPSVPKVPLDPSSSGSDNPVAGPSGVQSNRPSSSIYGEHPNMDVPEPASQSTLAGSTSEAPINHFQLQQNDMLNSHIVNLNGGRIIVDNMAGSRAPLPGFTSFV